MFRISMLPADYGDCIWLEYGPANKPHRVLIDGGTPAAYKRIEKWIPDGGCHFDLLVVTHMDGDHIGGVLKLLTHLPHGVSFGEVWFNGWQHLAGDTLGAPQAEMLSLLIERRELPWNAAFGGAAVCIPDEGPLPSRELDGGLRLTLLSPSREELRKLRPKWEEEVRKAGMEPGSSEDALRLLREREKLPPDLLGDQEPPDPERDAETPFFCDDSEANGSSIVLLAELDGRRALLCGDSFPTLLERGLDRYSESGRIEIDALKLAHHGSKNNTSSDLLERLRCHRYLVSTNGHVFGHPDNAALGRIVVRGGDGPTLYFNYRTPHTEPWDDARLRERYGYQAVFGGDDGGVTIDL